MNRPFLLHRRNGAAPALPFEKRALGAHDPFAATREVAWQDPGRLAAGRIAFAGTLRADAYPFTETLVVVEGSLGIGETGGRSHRIQPEQGVVIGRGTPVEIDAAPGTRVVFCTAIGAGPAKPFVGRLANDLALEAMPTLPKEILLGPQPDCRRNNLLQDDATRYRSGVFEATPFHRIVRPHPVHELMHFLSGSGRFATPEGELSAEAGDTLFVPRDAPMGWRSDVSVAKIYGIQD